MKSQMAAVKQRQHE